MISASSPVSFGSQSSLSSSRLDSAPSPTPFASLPPLSVVADPRLSNSIDELVFAVHEMEGLIQRTCAASASVIAAYVKATASESLSPLTGHQFVASMTKVGSELSSALSSSADGHRLLRTLADKLGYDPTAYGDGATDPHEEGFRHRGALSRVA